MLCSTDGKCPCSCNYATDQGCTCRNLAESINVTLTKSPVYSTYPLTYVQAFNSAPTEVGPPCCNPSVDSSMHESQNAPPSHINGDAKSKGWPALQVSCSMVSARKWTALARRLLS